MRQFTTKTKLIKLAAASAIGLGVSASAAMAGGLEVREQSTFFQGMSFAGVAAAGDSISSMFWNPAAASIASPGLTTESNYALIIPRADLTINSFDLPVGGTAPCSVGFVNASTDCSEDIGRLAVVPASYLAWRYNSQTVFALSMNSQFGLGTKPDNPGWAGQSHVQTSKLFSINITPTVAYEIMPGVSIGAGVQFQYLDLKRFRSSGSGQTLNLSGDDLGVGFTLGVNFKPTATTSIGIGYRSKIRHDLEGSLTADPVGFANPIAGEADTPEKVTVSFRQELSSNMRLLGTVEWVNWSRFGVVPIQNSTITIPLITPNGVVLDFQWDDGWFFSLGGEYDYSDKLTLRAGAAYEISPIDDPTARLMQVPDADRVWLSFGATYQWNEAMSLDFAYSHVFVEDARFIRDTAGRSGLVANGTADSAVDIVSVGLKMKLPPLD